MIATAQARLLACTKNVGKDKEQNNREFVWFKYDLLTPETGVSTFTGGLDYTPLIEKDVLITFDVKSKTEVKLVKLEEFSEGEKVVN